MKVFLDTNVLLDVLTRRRPFFEASSQIWTLAERGRIRGLISAISYPNIYYIVRKLSGREAADKVVLSLRAIFTVVACDERIIGKALDSKFDDFEDAIQFYSALRARVTCIVTRDPDHFPNEGPAVRSPTEFLATNAFE